MFGVRERLPGSQSSVSGIWVLEVELRSSDTLVVRAFTHWTTLPAPGYRGLKRMNKLPTDICNMAWIPKTPKSFRSVWITVGADFTGLHFVHVTSVCSLSSRRWLCVSVAHFQQRGMLICRKWWRESKLSRVSTKSRHEGFLLVLLLCFALAVIAVGILILYSVYKHLTKLDFKIRLLLVKFYCYILVEIYLFLK